MYLFVFPLSQLPRLFLPHLLPLQCTRRGGRRFAKYPTAARAAYHPCSTIGGICAAVRRKILVYSRGGITCIYMYLTAAVRKDAGFQSAALRCSPELWPIFIYINRLTCSSSPRSGHLEVVRKLICRSKCLLLYVPPGCKFK